jgi:hypothetical protein
LTLVARFFAFDANGAAHDARRFAANLPIVAELLHWCK